MKEEDFNMPKFTLIAEHTNWYTGKVESKVTYEFEADGITDVLQNTDLFIRGVGYFPEGTLEYVPDENYGEAPEWRVPEWETPQDDISHSEFFFDTERNK